VREMRVMAVGVESGALRPVLVLQEASGDHRLLPVWIGTAEANAITVEQQHVSLPRPITHQLIGDVLEALGRRLEQVRITEVRDNVFYAMPKTACSTRPPSPTPRSAQRATTAHPTRSRSSGGSSTPPLPRTSTRTDP
jgi:hypothetical protein